MIYHEILTEFFPEREKMEYKQGFKEGYNTAKAEIVSFLTKDVKKIRDFEPFSSSTSTVSNK